MLTDPPSETSSRRPTGTRIIMGARRRRLIPARASASLLERIQELQRERGSTRPPTSQQLTEICAMPAARRETAPVRRPSEERKIT